MKQHIFTAFIIINILFSMSAFLSAKEDDQVQVEKKEDFEVEYSRDEVSNNDENKEHRTIIITADRLAKDSKDVPLASSVVNSEKIEEKINTSMADLLDGTPGFTQVYDYHSPLILRGLTGNNMLLLRNGHPRFSSMPGGFMGQTVNIYDIDRIEVIRGPGSVIYGSGAMVGVVNIIDKDIFSERGLNVQLGGAYGTNNNFGMGLARAQWSNDAFAFMTSSRYRKADNMHYANNEEALNSFHEDKDVSFKAGYKPNEKNTIVLSSNIHFGGPWGKPYGFNRKEQILAQNENDNSYHFSAEYSGQNIGIFENLIFSAFYDYETRDYHKKKMNSTLTKVNFDEIVNYEDQYGGGYVLGTVGLGNHILSVGGNGYIFRIWSPGKTIDYYNYSEPTTTDEIDGAQGAGTTSIGTFAQDTWSITKSFSLIGGLRYDYAMVTEGKVEDEEGEIEKRHAVSGNTGMVYKTSSTSSITLNIARAFRMPDSMDMFAERATCAGTLYANPDLDPEYSWNVDLGFRGSYKRFFYWDSALFANFYDNLIVKVPSPDDPGGSIKDNEEIARIMGGEINLYLKIRKLLPDGMMLQPGVMSALYRGDSFSEGGNPWEIWTSGDALHGVQPVRIKSYLRYSFMSDLANYFFEVEADTSLKKYRVPEVESEAPWSNEDTRAYTLFNVTTGIRVFNTIGLEEIKFNVSVHNVLDKKYYPFGSHIPGKGRNIKFFASALY